MWVIYYIYTLHQFLYVTFFFRKIIKLHVSTSYTETLRTKIKFAHQLLVQNPQRQIWSKSIVLEIKYTDRQKDEHKLSTLHWYDARECNGRIESRKYSQQIDSNRFIYTLNYVILLPKPTYV
jgi:hypothetical protein